LSRWAADIDRINRRTTALVKGVGNEQLQRKPAEGGWSMAEVLEHLAVANESYLSAIGATPLVPVRRDAKPWQPSLFGRMLTFAFRKPRLRMKSPRVFAPGARPRDAVFHGFLRTQLELRRALERHLSSDLNLTRVTSPAVRWVRFNLGDCFEILITHADRHLDQIETIRKRISSESPVASSE
jgi:hypothetical protein